MTEFDDWFVAHYAAIAAFAHRRCASPQDAEDATAEVFAVAWRRFAEVPDGDAGRLWLFGVARHVLANQRRGATRRLRLHGRLAALPRAHADPPALPGGALRDALATLRPGDRELLLLAAWEELSVGEIATVLRLPAPVVSTRLSRARKRLAAALDPTTEEPDAHRLRTA